MDRFRLVSDVLLKLHGPAAGASSFGNNGDHFSLVEDLALITGHWQALMDIDENSAPQRPSACGTWSRDYRRKLALQKGVQAHQKALHGSK